MAESKFIPGTRREKRDLPIEALFPLFGKRYLSADDIEELRQLSFGEEDVTIPPRTAMEIVCDLVNAPVELKQAKELIERQARKAEGEATNLHPGGPWEYKIGLSMGYLNALALLDGWPVDKLPTLNGINRELSHCRHGVPLIHSCLACEAREEASNNLHAVQKSTNVSREEYVQGVVDGEYF